MKKKPFGQLAQLLLAALVFGGARAGATTPTLIWSDEFNQADGTAPDPAKWNYDLGTGTPAGWGSSQLESYTNSRSNSLIVSDPGATDGKALAIRSQNTGGVYTSARIQTAVKFTFQYGRLEARAKLPAGIGYWPAIWAIGSDENKVGWPACGEIDVMEWVGQTPGRIQGTLHGTGFGNTVTAGYVLPNHASYSDAYHVFAVDWYPNQIVFSMDGTVYFNQTSAGLPTGAVWPFDQPFFILLNLAIGGTWPGPPNAQTVFPQDYLIDYVRVYSLPTTPPPGLVWAPAPPSNLSSDSSVSGQLTLSWQAPSDTFGAAVSGYTLERATDQAFTQNTTVWNLGTATSYSDRSVTSGTSYYYRISAVSANGVSDPSAVVETAAPPPPTPSPTPTPSPAPPSRLINLSARAYAGTGANVLIAGFVIQGPSPLPVLIRTAGPALSNPPANIAGTLSDPQLQLYDGNTVIATDAGWNGDPQLVSAAADTGAMAWPDPASADSALLQTLTPGPFTAISSGVSGDTGVALAEIYDASPAATFASDSPRLVNISARAFVGTGADVLIAGFVIGGTSPMTVLIRASGPALAKPPNNVAGTLPDPQLNLYSGSTVIASNTGWAGDPAIGAAAAASGASPWTDPASGDSALLETLPPGPYTAIVSGVSGDTGVALVEVYAVP